MKEGLKYLLLILILFLMINLFTVPSQPVYIEYKDIFRILTEVEEDYSSIYDPGYYAYSYLETLNALNSACYQAWDLIRFSNVEYSAGVYDCEDVAELILSLVKLKLNNPACFKYFIMYKNDGGHAMIACIVVKDGRFERLYYDINCREVGRPRNVELSYIEG